MLGAGRQAKLIDGFGWPQPERMAPIYHVKRLTQHNLISSGTFSPQWTGEKEGERIHHVPKKHIKYWNHIMKSNYSLKKPIQHYYFTICGFLKWSYPIPYIAHTHESVIKFRTETTKGLRRPVLWFAQTQSSSLPTYDWLHEENLC